MKYHFALIFVTIIALTQAEVKNERLRAIIAKMLQVLFEYETNCIEESMVSEDAVDKYWKHEYNGDDDQKLKCYVKCSLIKLKALDENGVFLVEDLMQQNGIIHQLMAVYPDLIRTGIEKCKGVMFTDVCEKAYQLMQCGFKVVLDQSESK